MQNTNSNQNDINKDVDYPFIAILIGSDYKFFRPKDIIYCQADGNYTKVYFQSGKAATTTKKLKELEMLLPSESFVRVHHSYIINIEHVTKYLNGDSQEIEMRNGEKVMVSRRKKHFFLSKFIKL